MNTVDKLHLRKEELDLLCLTLADEVEELKLKSENAEAK